VKTFCHIVATALILMLPSDVVGAPLHFRVSMVGGYISGENPSTGYHLALANIQLDISFDAATLTPLPPYTTPVSRVTRWPVTNTVSKMTVQGTNGYDGTFDGTADDTSTASWAFLDNSESLGDAIRAPTISFRFHRNTVTFTQLIVKFDDAFFTGDGQIFPKEFAADEGEWREPIYWYNYSKAWGGHPTGSASFLPEPTTFTIGCIPLAALAALRRRK
jgi:hypothetical protein